MTDSIISNEFGVNLGQVVVETYRLIDEEPALAELSLSELRGRLENEGLPIDVVIEQLSIFSDSNNNFLNTFLLQVKPRLDEPDGLQILTDSIDGQSPEISGKIHQLLDESVQSSLSIDKVAGGSGSIRHPWMATAGTVVVGGVATRFGLAYRRKKIELRETESRGVQAAEKDSQAAAKDIFRDNRHLSDLVRDENVKPVQTADQAEIRLIKDVNRYTEKEIGSLLEPFVLGSEERFNQVVDGLGADEIKFVKLKMVDKLILKDSTQKIERVLDIPGIEIKGATAEEKLENLNIAVNKGAEELRAEVREKPDLLKKYMDRRFLEPYREAFNGVNNNDGKLILNDTRKQLDDDMAKTLKEAGITAKREEAAAGRAEERKLERDFANLDARRKLMAYIANAKRKMKADIADAKRAEERELERDLANLDAKIETSVDNTLEEILHEIDGEKDAIDNLVIDTE
jgi:hypothetical protein